MALARAYAGQGATLIEAMTYRMGPHTTSDDPTRYRSRAEEEEWREKDPIARLRALLRSEGQLADAFEATVEERAAEAAATLRARCLVMPDPAPEAMFDHVYVDPHPLLQEEREAYAAYQAGFEEPLS